MAHDNAPRSRRPTLLSLRIVHNLLVEAWHLNPQERIIRAGLSVPSLNEYGRLRYWHSKVCSTRTISLPTHGRAVCQRADGAMMVFAGGDPSRLGGGVGLNYIKQW
jgi:hypothetical protein